MPNYLKYLVCLLLAGVACSASGQSRLPSFDTGFKTMRENAVGADFHYSVDDYLQYSPAAVLLGLKVAGYESRTSWGRMAVSDAFSVAVMAAAVNGIKYSVARMRPDGSSRNSFPSGHTATAFMLAAMLHEEYGWRSPWFSFGGYAVASFTGVSRILNNRHWTSDILLLFSDSTRKGNITTSGCGSAIGSFSETIPRKAAVHVLPEAVLPGLKYPCRCRTPLFSKGRPDWLSVLG